MMANHSVSGLSKKTCPAIAGTGAGFGEISMHFHETVSKNGHKKIRFHGGKFWMEIVEMFGAHMPANRCRATICGKRGRVEIKGARMVCKSLKFLILPLSTLFSPPTGEREVGTSPPLLRPGGETRGRKERRKIKGRKTRHEK